MLQNRCIIRNQIDGFFQELPRLFGIAELEAYVTNGGVLVLELPQGAVRDQFAADGQGGTCTGEVSVGVPRSEDVAPVDGGALYDSTLAP